MISQPEAYFLHLGRVSVLALFALVGLGCQGRGDSDYRRYPLKGAAIFQGKPIPSGEVMFSPSSEAGNSGPGSFAAIENGKYSLSKGQGVVGGDYILEISGFEGPPTLDGDGELVPAKRLFHAFEMQANIPAGGIFDIVVPDNSAH